SITVLDWTEVDVGDPHADVAVARMFMDCFQLKPQWWLERAGLWIGRIMLRQRYLRAYRRRIRLNLGTLAYYRAWAALRRLGADGRWLDAGPSSTGAKPTTVRNLTQEHINIFCRYFEKWSGVRVSLESGTAAEPQ